MAASVSTEKKQETTITTLLNVRRGAEAIDFYTRALGATILFRMDGDDGSVVAHLAVGEGDFWLADESLPHVAARRTRSVSSRPGLTHGRSAS